MKNILKIAVVLILVIYGYQKFKKPSDVVQSPPPQAATLTLEEVDDIAPTYNDHSAATSGETKVDKPASTLSTFTCDGRTHCSQMTSCEEATYFLQQCPNTQMDGNGDGIPCEKQWCK